MDHEWLLTSISNDPNIDVLYHFFFFWIIEQKAGDLRRKSLLCLFFCKVSFARKSYKSI